MAQPQTQDVSNPQAIQGLNSKWVNGVAPGYRPLVSSGLVLSLSAGTSFFAGVRFDYAGGTLTLTNNTTNYVYLDTTASNAPAFNTTGYSGIPVCTVVTSGGAITSIVDDRTWFTSGSVTGGVDARTTTSETITVGDLQKLVTFSNASPISVTLNTSSCGSKFFCAAEDLGAGNATFTPSSGTINGNASLTISTSQGIWLFCDGTNWWAVLGASGGLVRKVGITIDGGGSAITTGVKGSIQVDFSGTIVGWSIEADQSGSINVDVDKHSGTQTVPVVPNTTTDKISASAPIALTTAQAAGVGTSGVSTWTTSVAQWDSIQFNVTSATTVTRVTLYVRIQT